MSMGNAAGLKAQQVLGERRAIAGDRAAGRCAGGGVPGAARARARRGSGARARAHAVRAAARGPVAVRRHRARRGPDPRRQRVRRQSRARAGRSSDADAAGAAAGTDESADPRASVPGLGARVRRAWAHAPHRRAAVTGGGRCAPLSRRQDSSSSRRRGVGGGSRKPDPRADEARHAEAARRAGGPERRNGDGTERNGQGEVEDDMDATDRGTLRRSLGGSCAARDGVERALVADRGAAAHAAQQPRSGGRRAPRGARRLRRLGTRGAIARGAAGRSCDAAAAGDDETLLVQSGKPVGVFRTHAGAPRVLIANSLLVPTGRRGTSSAGSRPKA